MLGLPVGMFLSFVVSGHLAHAHGWRTAFFVAGLPGLVLAMLVLLVNEPQRGASEGRGEVARRPGQPFLVLLGIPTLLWIIVSGALHNFNMYAVTTFLGALLARYHALDLKVTAWSAALIMGLAGVLGLLAGGWLADRAGRWREDGRLRLGAGALAVAAPCVYLALSQPGGAVAAFVVFMTLGMACVHVYYSTVYAAIQDVVEPGLRGTAMAMYFFAMYVLGASFGPLGTGLLSDFCARRAMTLAGATTLTEEFRAAGLHHAMHVVPVLCALLALVLFAASRTVGRDMARLREWQAAQRIAGR
jgi:MFS family permease